MELKNVDFAIDTINLENGDFDGPQWCCCAACCGSARGGVDVE